MPDYNIYLHSVGGGSGSGGDGGDTKPKQTKTPEEKAAKLEKEAAKAAAKNYKQVTSAVRTAGSFVTNPDSIISAGIGKAKSALLSGAAGMAVGTVGVILAVGVSVIDRALTIMNNYVAPASGNYAFEMAYGNLKQKISNFTHPVSTVIARRQAELQIRKQNAVNEQQMLLTGGTILNNPNGRYL